MHAIREATASPHKHFVFARIVLLRNTICRSGGTGRRPGLKIPWVVIPVPVRFRSAALKTSYLRGFFSFSRHTFVTPCVRTTEIRGFAALNVFGLL